MIVYTVLLILVIAVILDRWKSKKLKKLYNIVGSDSPYIPIIGHAYTFFGSSKDRMDRLKSLAYYGYGNKHGMATIWSGPYLISIVSDADQAVAVLKSTNSKGSMTKIVKRLSGGVAFASTNVWHSKRKIIIPSFSPKNLRQFVHVFESQSKVTVKNLESKVGKGNFSVWDYVVKYSMDSICETAFGLNLNIQRQNSLEFLNALSQYFHKCSVLMWVPWGHIDAVYNLLPVKKEQDCLKYIIHNFVDDLINKKIALIAGTKCTQELQGVKPSRINIQSLLESMIKTSNEDGKKYSTEDLRDEVITLAVAGSDTSTTGSCFLAVLLSRHSDIQEKVYQEIMEVLGEEAEVKMSDLPKLKYLDAVIKETLRLYPPVPAVSRYMFKDTVMPSGVMVPSKTSVIINLWGIHNNPKYWGADVGEFNPDRFISRPPPPPNSYMPFATGPRNCIGYQYAMLSMKTNIVTLLRNYRLLPATSFTYGKSDPLRVNCDIMMKHADNFQIQIEPRSENRRNVLNNI